MKGSFVGIIVTLVHLRLTLANSMARSEMKSIALAMFVYYYFKFKVLVRAELILSDVPLELALERPY